ncbi:hypothetical protein VNO77_14605 [Canavalia gladiata]|uniref:Uncharacterized protein n=1 Tax=Canavalia gladiata TaxID=3824 RepID=A0AAN9QVH8_CANGL
MTTPLRTLERQTRLQMSVRLKKAHSIIQVGARSIVHYLCVQIEFVWMLFAPVVGTTGSKFPMPFGFLECVGFAAESSEYKDKEQNLLQRVNLAPDFLMSVSKLPLQQQEITLEIIVKVSQNDGFPPRFLIVQVDRVTGRKQLQSDEILLKKLGIYRDQSSKDAFEQQCI